MAEVKRIQVSFTEQQWKLLNHFKGELGESDAEVIRTIVMSWLAEKSFITDTVKTKIRNGTKK
ncbi:MAG: CopG family transcriptional regulator [Candidatus Nephrothrix sp. EaCA]|nr:MAG: CopG family transcriptional regulator [Candidatus Nephrothrix sp. EaCA]